MDGMKIESKFMTGIISKLITVTLKKKLGSEVKIKVNSIRVQCGETITFDLDISGEMTKETLTKLIFKEGS